MSTLIPYFVQGLRNNKVLTTLRLAECQLEDEHLEPLGKAMRCVTVLVSVWKNGNLTSFQRWYKTNG